MHNKDAVDLLWTKLNNAELAIFVASIKVDYRCNRQKYTEVLQENDTQIPTGKTPPFTTSGVSEHKTGGRINAMHQRALQKEHIYLMVRSIPDPICTSSE